MAATLVEKFQIETHVCIFCDVDAIVSVYANGSEVISCPICKDVDGIIYTGEDDVYDIEDGE